MRRAAGSLHSLRLAGEQLGAAGASACGGGTAAASSSSSRLLATTAGCLVRATASQAAGVQRQLASTACRGGSAAAAAAQPSAASCSGRLAGAAAAALLAAGRHSLPAQRGLHTAARWQAAAPLRWQPLGGSLRQRAPSARLRASYGAYTAAQAPIAAAVSAGIALPAAAAAAVAAAARRSSRRAARAAAAAAASRGLPSRWAQARKQLRDRAAWVLGKGYHAREAFINAVYMQVRAHARCACACAAACHGSRALLLLARPSPGFELLRLLGSRGDLR